jgi:hypothetical protein
MRGAHFLKELVGASLLMKELDDPTAGPALYSIREVRPKTVHIMKMRRNINRKICRRSS